MATQSIVNYGIDDLFAISGVGSLDKALGLNLYGFSMTQSPSAIPRNKQQPGYVFFTRPQLNLSTDNIRNARRMYNLLNDDPLSMERFIRCTLDPRLAIGFKFRNVQYPTIGCPLVDPENPFIAFMTNNAMTVTGWPEETMTFQKSKPDVYNGTHTQANGISWINSSYTTTATIRNVMGDPLVQMLHYWKTYMSHVTTHGGLRPYPDYETADIKDYNTRTYRIWLDPTRRKCAGIIAPGAQIPASNSISAMGDYNRDTPIADINKDLSITFESDGLMILDNILVRSFNGTVEAWCPGMRDGFRERFMVKLGPLSEPYFRHLAMPRINPLNSDFEWWVSREKYQRRAQTVMALTEANNRQSETAEIETDPDTPTSGESYYV